MAGGAEEHLLDTLLALCREQKLLSAGSRQRTDSTHVLGAVRSLNRLECVTETRPECPGICSPRMAAHASRSCLGGAIWQTGQRL
jgi:hypothetical protein